MNSKNKTILGVGVIILIAAGLFLMTNNKSKSTTSTDNAQVVLQDYTSEQVSSHNNKNDCWAIIDGGVYNITSYIPRHQGGDNILSACGVDATAFFNGEKTGQAGGTNDHSNVARNQLEKLKVGKIVE